MNSTSALLAGAAAGLAGLLALAVLPASASAASPTKREPGQCFYSRNIESFSAPDRQTLNLRVNLHDYYQAKLIGPCTDLPFAQTIGLKSRGSSWICSGLDVEVIVPSQGGGPPQRCMATSLHKLTPEEAAAMPAKDKP